MPSLFKMADVKDSASYETPPVVISQVAADVPKSRNVKKVVIIAASAIASVVIVLTAILVGMYIFSEANKEIIKFTMNVDKDTKEDVTADQNENVVQYHVQNVNYEMWVVDDFNQDIEVIKIQTKTDTNCYAVPLNRTTAVTPSKVKIPTNVDTDTKVNVTDPLVYEVSSTPISDSSFLAKKAKELCKGISVYWMYPKCESNPAQRQKRGICYGCYYYYYYYYGSLYYRPICYYYYCW